MCISWILIKEFKYRVVHKSLWDFRPLRYRSRDGDAEGEHVNRGTDTPSFCPTLQVLDMSTLGDAADVTIDSVLANPKTQNASLFPAHAMFRHDCHLAAKPANTPRRLVHEKKLGDILYLLICFCLLRLSWLLCGRVRKFRRNL